MKHFRLSCGFKILLRRLTCSSVRLAGRKLSLVWLNSSNISLRENKLFFLNVCILRDDRHIFFFADTRCDFYSQARFVHLKQFQIPHKNEHQSFLWLNLSVVCLRHTAKPFPWIVGTDAADSHHPQWQNPPDSLKSPRKIYLNDMQMVCMWWHEGNAIMLTAQTVLVVVIIIIIAMIIIIPNILISAERQRLRGSRSRDERTVEGWMTGRWSSGRTPGRTGSFP